MDQPRKRVPEQRRRNTNPLYSFFLILIGSGIFAMAQVFQTRQRLLATLSRTARYYETRPAHMLPNCVRDHSEIAASRAQGSTGFSITFADGPLANIVAKSVGSTSEVMTERETSKKKTTGLPKPKTTKISPRKIAVEKKGNVELETSPSSEYRDVENLDSYAEMSEQQPLPKEYPDTRTIDDAGRPPVSREGGDVKKNEADLKKPSKEQRPLASYKEPWQVQKAALKNKFGGEGWNPRKKLSPDTMEGIRALHAQYPEQYTTQILAEHFAVSPEAVRRILKSKWSSNLDPEKAAERRERWAKRHDRLWDIKSEIGLRPKRRSEKKLEDPERFEEDLRAKQMLEAYRNA